MNNKLNNLKTAADEIRLSHAEKSAMKAQVFGMPSPKTVAPKSSPYFIYSFQFINARVLAPLAVLVVVFAGAGTAAAAQGTLPGDLLYPVKVSVNEAIEVALATTPVARAQVESSLAQRRVEEAEALAAQGNLTAEQGEALALQFEAHAESAKELADQVATDDPDTATNLRATLDTSLSAHGAILAALGEDNTRNRGTDTVVASVLARADQESSARIAAAEQSGAPQAKLMTISFTVATGTAKSADTMVASDASTNLENLEEKGAVQKLRSRAAAALLDARKRFDRSKELDATTTAQVESEFKEIGVLLADGDSALAINNYAQAQAQFSDAFKASIHLNVLLRAQEKLDTNVISPILEQGDRSGELEGEVRVLPAL